jgi:hypothetical protein
VATPLGRSPSPNDTTSCYEREGESWIAVSGAFIEKSALLSIRSHKNQYKMKDVVT